MLALFDFIVVKLFDPTAIKAHQMIMMRALVKFKDGFASFKMITTKQASLLELRQYPIYRCQTDIEIFGKQELVYIFR